MKENEAYLQHLPATHAFMNDAVLPAINARNATCAKSLCRSGAMVANAAIWVPIDPGLANPHNAKVAIVSDRFCILLQEKKITISKIRKKQLDIHLYELPR